jgi:hypothetical protein
VLSDYWRASYECDQGKTLHDDQVFIAGPHLTSTGGTLWLKMILAERSSYDIDYTADFGV